MACIKWSKKCLRSAAYDAIRFFLQKEGADVESTGPARPSFRPCNEDVQLVTLRQLCGINVGKIWDLACAAALTS